MHDLLEGSKLMASCWFEFSSLSSLLSRYFIAECALLSSLYIAGQLPGLDSFALDFDCLFSIQLVDLQMTAQHKASSSWKRRVTFD